MEKRIIYPADDGTLKVVAPAPGCELSIEEIAAIVVPEGKPFRIVDVTEIPADRSQRGAWEYS